MSKKKSIKNLIADPQVRTCRICGCTDEDCSQCIEKTGQPCHWVDEDLCSACDGEEEGSSKESESIPSGHAEFKMIPLKKVMPDAQQPRKFFDQIAQDELTDSIRKKGILQPVLVRPASMKDRYLLVCGERRLRAAKTAGLQEIPAMIRDLTDDEALELQIIENLQRKDVHPMEEAIGFKSLLDHKQLDTLEIAARVGKSVFYVRQRLKLNDLVPAFQTAYFEGRLSAKLALELCTFQEEVQNSLIQECGNNGGEISFTSWYLNKFRGILAEAPFALDDTTLDRKAGPCTGCQSNSATAALFPKQEQSPICTNIKCFAHKCDVHFDHELAKAKAEPGMIFIDDGHGGLDGKFKKNMEKEGFTIKKTGYGHDARILEAPEMPTLAEYNPNNYDSEKDRLDEFDEDMKEYESRKEAYDEKIEGGKFKRAFVVNGVAKGKYVHVTLPSAARSSKETSQKEASGDLTLSDINEEIKRISDREERAVELDAEKVHKRIVEAVDKDPSVKKLPTSVDHIDVNQLCKYLLYDLARNALFGKVKTDAGLPGSIRPDPEKIKESLQDMTDNQLVLMIRNIAFGRFHANIPQRGFSYGAFVFRKMAETLGTIPIETFEAEQKEIAAKRKARVEARIAELKAKKSELKKAQPKPDPKPKAGVKKGK